MVDGDAHRKQDILKWKDHAVGRSYEMPEKGQFTVVDASRERESIQQHRHGPSQTIRYWCFRIEWANGTVGRMSVDEHLSLVEIGHLTEVDSVEEPEDTRTVDDVLAGIGDECPSVVRVAAYRNGRQKSVAGDDWLTVLQQTDGEVALRVSPAPPKTDTHYVVRRDGSAGTIRNSQYTIASRDRGEDWTTTPANDRDVLELLVGAADLTLCLYSSLPSAVTSQLKTPMGHLLS